MRVSRIDAKKQAAAPGAISVKKRIVRKSAKAAAKKAGYAAYVRDTLAMFR